MAAFGKAATRSETRHPRRVAAVVCALLAAALLAGCATTASRAPQAPAYDPGLSHVVRRGDTVYALAKRYGSSPAAIRRENGLDASYTIHLGQTLRIPNGRGAPAATRRAAVPAAPRAAQPRAERRVAAAPKRQTPRAASASYGPPKSMMRPAEGEIVKKYGEEVGGAANVGVDIGAPAGSPVVAADDGQVAFISDATTPLGSVILVQHDGGMVTIYGRIDGVAVRQGQRVSRGQQIANVARPRGGQSALHFELRRGSEPIDPTPYI